MRTFSGNAVMAGIALATILLATASSMPDAAVHANITERVRHLRPTTLLSHFRGSQDGTTAADSPAVNNAPSSALTEAYFMQIMSSWSNGTMNPKFNQHCSPHPEASHIMVCSFTDGDVGYPNQQLVVTKRAVTGTWEAAAIFDTRVSLLADKQEVKSLDALKAFNGEVKKWQLCLAGNKASARGVLCFVLSEKPAPAGANPMAADKTKNAGVRGWWAQRNRNKQPINV